MPRRLVTKSQSSRVARKHDSAAGLEPNKNTTARLPSRIRSVRESPQHQEPEPYPWSTIMENGWPPAEVDASDEADPVVFAGVESRPQSFSRLEDVSNISIPLKSLEQSAVNEEQVVATTMLDCSSSLTTLMTTASVPKETQLMAHQNSSIEIDDDCGKKVIIPEVGMCFESEEDAYNMYNSYAKKIGFSIRRVTRSVE